MKQILLFIIIFFVILSAIAQESSSIYLVQFKDKNASEYSVDKPSEYLSAKAIERRQVQHIPINSTDLPVNINYINQVKAVDVSILNHSKWLNAITISGADVNKINAIKVLSCVKSISKIKDASNPQLSTKFDVEQKSKISTLEKSNNSSATSTALNYGLSYSQAHQLNVDCLHAMGYMGQGVTIAVLDAGFQDVNILPAFDSLRMNNRLLGTWDFVMGDSMVFEDNIHGMEVLSCMTGNLPGELIGTAPKANFWLLRTEDAGSESISEEVNWLLGAEFADSVGADVINSSLGYTTFDNSANNHTYADLDGNTTIITKAADWAASKGILVVSSAGNYGTGPWYKIGAPADADSILTVGAIDSMGLIANFSSHGPTFDGRVKPNTVARGVVAVIASTPGGISVANGTSFSSPITAGAVACLRQANPNASTIHILDIIQQSANRYTTPDTLYGYGIPNFCAANIILAGIQEQLKEKEQLIVYPNPFSEEVNISFYSEKKQEIQVTIIDVLGKVIYKQNKTVNANTNNTFSIAETKHFPSGLYLVSLSTPEVNFYERIIKK